MTAPTVARPRRTPDAPGRLSDLAAARLTLGLSLLFAALTLVSHRPVDLALAAGATGLGLAAAIMLLHRHGAAPAQP